MFIKKYLDKLIIIVAVVTILFGNIIITPTLAKKVDVQNVNVEAKNVLGIQIAFNIDENKQVFRKGDTIDYYYVYPRENIDNSEFDLYFFNAKPILADDLSKKFDIKYFISKDESLEKDRESVKKFDYEEIKYDSNLNKVFKDVSVFKIQLKAKDDINKNNIGKTEMLAPFYVNKPSDEYYRDSTSKYRIYLDLSNKNIELSASEFLINLNMKGNTKRDIYKLIGKDLELNVNDDFNEKDLISIATLNGEDATEEVKFTYPVGITKDNISEKSGEVKVTLTLEDKIVETIVTIKDGYKLEGRDLELNINDDFNEKDLISIATLNGEDATEEVKFTYPVGITKDNINEKAGDIKIILTLGGKSVEVKVLVKEKLTELKEEKDNENLSSKKRRKKKETSEKVEKIEKISQVNTGYPFDTINHMAYINGYEDGTFRPEKSITREEVSTILYRVLDENYRNSKKSNSNNFKDVENTRWSNTEISTLANANVIKGYEDGEFKPVENMTRAEVSAVIARFYNLTEENQNKFSDTKGHWAEEYINIVAEKGLIKGYEDGSFKPDQEITRAEFVTMINRLLERDLEKIMLNENLKEFSDVNKSDWYYEDILEAANGHEYTKENYVEKWIEFKVFNIK